MKFISDLASSTSVHAVRRIVVTLSAQDHVVPQYLAEVTQKFSEFVKQADRFAGAFSVDDTGNVRDWAVPGIPGAGTEHYSSTFHVDAEASRDEVIQAVDDLAARTTAMLRRAEQHHIEE